MKVHTLEDYTSKTVQQAAAVIKHLNEENTKLREQMKTMADREAFEELYLLCKEAQDALQFYADRSNWCDTVDGDTSAIGADQGQVARKVLGTE